MKRFILLITLIVVSLVFAAAPINAQQPIQETTWGRIKVQYGEQTHLDRPNTLDPKSIGAYTAIAWPFPWESPNDWRGDEGDRTDGGWYNSRCAGWIPTHSGADHYARDLSRRYKSTAGARVYAGLTAKVVKIEKYGAGWSVVLYYPKQRLCIRYAHMDGIVVNVGWTVSMRQYLGYVLDQGSGSHLHLVVYENVPEGSNGFPAYIPSVCNRDTWHACRVYFFS
ncbi:MAG: M23 family metallopeptidase [Patescibacteria group bacterium]|jgi:murein DD-endopeptidase MepM/ murein hydrolase activator NlpD